MHNQLYNIGHRFAETEFGGFRDYNLYLAIFNGFNQKISIILLNNFNHAF